MASARSVHVTYIIYETLISVIFKLTVVLTSKEAMFTVIQHEAAMGRDRSGLFADRSFNKNLGIATGEGEIWEKSRVWMFKKLREYGFGKSMEMEHHIKVGE